MVNRTEGGSVDRDPGQPFDRGNDGDSRGQVPAEAHSDHLLKRGETVHFTEGSRPIHAPDTTAARATHSHGRLRTAFNRHFPAGTKRGTFVRASAVVAGGGAVAHGIFGGGAEQAGRTAEHVGHDVAAFVTAGPSESVATESPYADTKTTQAEVEASLAKRAADKRAAEAGAQAAETPDPGVTSAVDLDSPTPEDQTSVAETVSPDEVAVTEPRTGGAAPGGPVGSGGVAPS